MEDFRRMFALEAVVQLKRISADLQNADELSESFKREIFRRLHTIKGTAQTFEFSAASFLAHELENLLAAREISLDYLREGIEFLTESLKHRNFEIPPSFLNKIGAGSFEAIQTDSDFATSAFDIPDEFSSQLSEQEKIAVRSAARADRNVFCLEIGFELSNFANGLINFREVLDASGEIIATLPSAKFSAVGKIGFQILYASAAKDSHIISIAEQNGAAVIFDSSRRTSLNNFQSAAAHAVRHGKEIAKKHGKEICFEVAADEIKLDGATLKIIFDALLHLVRNAVDHGIETVGKVKISMDIQENNLRLTVADTGNGIDSAQIKIRALERNVISNEAILTAEQMLDLIFLSEFSTKSGITEISGRGIGLDAVKTAITAFGGAISVSSKSGEGTTFEIILPLKKTGEAQN